MQQALFLAYAAAAVAALAGGIVLVVKKHRATGVGLILVGSFLVLLPVGVVAMWFSPLGNPTSMQVEPLDPPNDPWFTVALRHTRDFENGAEYHFGNAGGPEQVAATFQEQHPTGVVTTANPAPMAQGAESIWHMSTDDVRYELEHTSDPDWYHLVTQLVVVHRGRHGCAHSVPTLRVQCDGSR